MRVRAGEREEAAGRAGRLPRLSQGSSYDRGMSTEPLRVLLERAFPTASELDVIDRGGGTTSRCM